MSRDLVSPGAYDLPSNAQLLTARILILLLGAAFVASVVIGVPIAFALAFSALLYFLAEPSLPMLVYSQQILAGPGAI